MDISEVIGVAREKFSLIQYDEEFIPFVQFIKDKGINSFIEIGTFKGGTMYVLSKICSGKKISIDFPNPAFGYSCNGDCTNPNYVDVNKRNTDLAIEFSDIHLITGDSHEWETFYKVKDLLDTEKVDLLFIDGDHTYEGVKKDYAMYKQLVREGGYVAFHDIKDCDFHRLHGCRVDLLWNELKGDKTEFLSEHPDRGIGIIKT